MLTENDRGPLDSGERRGQGFPGWPQCRPDGWWENGSRRERTGVRALSDTARMRRHTHLQCDAQLYSMGGLRCMPACHRLRLLHRKQVCYCRYKLKKRDLLLANRFQTRRPFLHPLSHSPTHPSVPRRQLHSHSCTLLTPVPPSKHSRLPSRFHRTADHLLVPVPVTGCAGDPVTR